MYWFFMKKDLFYIYLGIVKYTYTVWNDYVNDAKMNNTREIVSTCYGDMVAMTGIHSYFQEYQQPGWRRLEA